MFRDCYGAHSRTPEAHYPRSAEEAGHRPQDCQGSLEEEHYRRHSEEAGTVPRNARYADLDQFEVRIFASCI